MFSINNDDCERYLQLLGQELHNRGITGEILVSGDVVVLLDIHQSKIRRDLDAYLAGDDNALAFPTINDARGVLSRQGRTARIIYPIVSQLILGFTRQPTYGERQAQR